MNDEEIVIIGDGTSSRDYIYIDDATLMIATSFADAQHTLYNIGSGIQTSVNEIVNKLQSAMGKKATVKHIEEPKTFLKHAGIDIERFKAEFTMRPQVDLDKGFTLILQNLQQ